MKHAYMESFVRVANHDLLKNTYTERYSELMEAYNQHDTEAVLDLTAELDMIAAEMKRRGYTEFCEESNWFLTLCKMLKGMFRR